MVPIVSYIALGLTYLLFGGIIAAVFFAPELAVEVIKAYVLVLIPVGLMHVFGKNIAAYINKRLAKKK